MGRRFDSLTFVGGGAQSAVWCRVFAGVLGRPVRQAQAPMWANARGAAYVATAGLGYLKLDDLPDPVPVAATCEPDPAHRRLYDEGYGAFLELYRRNKGLMARLNRPGCA